jgi:signal transduction histidine kinase
VPFSVPASRPHPLPAADSHAGTVLVVDDERPNRDLLARRLGQHGFRVLTASGGTEALDALASRSCDLVLLDVMMPVMSGLEVLAAIRHNEAWRDLPVIMVTAKNESRDIVEALDLGADDYVTKPLDFPVALARVRAQLARVAAERAALARQRHGDLEHAQKISAVGQLAGGVAHDFNNLLTTIYGYGELLRDDLPCDDKRQDDVEHILKAAQTAASLTRQLLAYSRRHPSTPQVLDLGAVAFSMVRLLRRVIGEQIELSVQTPEELWPVFGDAGQLDQVVMNLVVNACDAMPHGGRLSLQLENAVATPPGSGAGDFVRLTVRDTGIGMSPETLARAFEPFFTTKGPSQGTGLGLAMVHHIIEQMGGTIAVTSAPGEGTTVRVLLPRTASATAEDEPGWPTGQEARAVGTVLLVEDDYDVRRYVRDVLVRAGYTVVDAARGDRALEAARLAGGIDLLVTDMVMPGMGGLALYAALQATHPGLPAVFMSGHDLQATPPGAAVPPVLQKPFTAAEFLASIRRVHGPASVAPPNAIEAAAGRADSEVAHAKAH